MRSREGRKIAGVCAGIGDYLGVDPVLVRVLWVVAFFCCFGLLAYLAAWIIIPNAPDPYWEARVQPSRA